MRIDKWVLAIAFAAGIFCTACVGPQAALAADEEPVAKKELVSDVQDETVAAAKGLSTPAVKRTSAPGLK